MSDKPNFQKIDEQEPVYAPQQVPGDERTDDNTDPNVDRVGVPAAGAGLLGMMGGGASTGVQGGAPSATGPAVASAAPEDDTAGDRPV